MTHDLGVREGSLKHNLPYFVLGSGKPLVVLRGFTPTHANPTGLHRKLGIRMLTPLAHHYRMYAINRPSRRRRSCVMWRRRRPVGVVRISWRR